jgi:thiol-disulfide isomerase/thioredoxin
MLLAALALAVAQQPITEWTELPPGIWSAWLDSPGGKLEFVLALPDTRRAPLVAWIRNAEEPVEVPIAEWSAGDKRLVLEFPHYDSRIDARASDDGLALDGEWTKRTGVDRWTRLSFHARHESEVDGADLDLVSDRWQLDYPPYEDPLELSSRWRVQFASDSDSAVASLNTVSDALIRGTFLTTLGDYRYLLGRSDSQARTLTLACFDGAHAFLFKAALQTDGSLKGDFWSGDSWHDTWTAVKDPDAELPDPFGLTKWNSAVQLEALEFPDLEGRPKRLSDPAFAGRARIVQVFGSWCPNCNDEAEFLRELDERYRERGLSIVGLAFELTGDSARDAKQVKLYAARHRIAFPLLLAGTADKTEASKRFPLLDKVRAYPTTLFLHADGRVRAVHQGFSGPATGPEHAKLRDDFERLIEELLAEGESKK